MEPKARCSSTGSPRRSHSSSWKFWRTMSIRRTDKKTRTLDKQTDSSRAGRVADWTHPSHLDLRPATEPKAVVKGTAATAAKLPDVLDKAVVKRSRSVRAPPKPPRLFLFRSSSAQQPDPPRSLDDEPRAKINMAAMGRQAAMSEDTEPIYVNAAFGAALKTGLSGNDRIIPPTINIITNQSDSQHQLHGEGGKKAGDGGEIREVSAEDRSAASLLAVPMKQTSGRRLSHTSILPPTPRPPSPSTPSPGPPVYHSLPHRYKPRHKSASADLSCQRPRERTRSRSTARSEQSSHADVLHNVMDLLCQKLDPFPLLDSLQSSGVLTAVDVKAFQDLPDRRLVCEKLVNIIGEGDESLFTAFLEVLRISDEQDEIVRVLDVMRDMNGLIRDIPCPADTKIGEEAPILAEEKVVSYEVGYLAHDAVSLKPIVELEKVRPSDRRLSLMAASRSSFSGPGTTLGGGYKESSKQGDRTRNEAGTGYTGPIMVNIYITGHNLSGQRALALAQILKQHDCILELRIGKTQLGSADLAAVCGAMLHNYSLSSLDIRLNTLDFVGASAVASVLTHTKALRKLNLSSTGIDAAGCVSVLTALMSNRTLTDLDLSFLNAGDSVCGSIRVMLKTNSSLQKLRLRSINISSAGCRILAEGLNRNRSLQQLDLSRNCLGDDGIEALARYVPESWLTEVSLENCSVTSAACVFLSRMIGASRRLRCLDLSVNYLGDEGVQGLEAALRRGCLLHTLALNMCGITNDGFCTLLDVLEKNSCLWMLKLCYNHLGRESSDPAASSDTLRHRLHVLTSSRPLLKVLLWGNAFDAA